MSADVSSGGWVRLSDWGRQFGRSPRVSWQMMKDGRLPEDLEVERIGRIYYVRSRSAVVSSGVRTVLYARVSGSDRSADLVRQVERIQVFARKRGWVVDEVVMETASGMNGKRRKLLRVLGAGGGVRLVVEHRDRLARFGFEMVEAAVRGAGGQIGRSATLFAWIPTGIAGTSPPRGLCHPKSLPLLARPPNQGGAWR